MWYYYKRNLLLFNHRRKKLKYYLLLMYSCINNTKIAIMSLYDKKNNSKIWFGQMFIFANLTKHI